MPTLSYNLTEAHATRLTDALCGLHSYQAQISDPNNEGQMIANPETCTAFSKRMLKEWMIAQVRRWEEAQAKKAAEATLTSIDVTEE